MSTTQSPRELDVKRLGDSVSILVVLLIIGSLCGVAIGGFASMLYVGATASFWTVTHEIGVVSVGITFALFLVPLWGLLGGGLFGLGCADNICSRLKVQLVHHSHPIAKRIQGFANDLGLSPIKYIGFYPGEEINAFAAGLGRKSAMIAFTEGAANKLNLAEFDAIMAHELGHIVNNDMARMTYARSFQNALTWFLIFKSFKHLARWMFTTISEIGIMALSRSREYWADAIAAVLIHPDAMISALKTIDRDQSRPPCNQKQFANLMFRANPAGLFNTHPTLEERIIAIQTEHYIKKLPLKTAEPVSIEFNDVTEPLAPEAFYS